MIGLLVLVCLLLPVAAIHFALSRRAPQPVIEMITTPQGIGAPLAEVPLVKRNGFYVAVAIHGTVQQTKCRNTRCCKALAETMQALAPLPGENASQFTDRAVAKLCEVPQ